MAKKEKIARGDRFDGVWLRSEPAMNRFMPYLYPNRADNEAYISEQVDLRALDAYLEKKNAGLTENKYTYFQVICAAIAKTFVLRPKLNHFVAGNRIYDRKYLAVAFVVKKRFSDHSEEELAFRKFEKDFTLDSFHASLTEEIHERRHTEATDNSTEFMEKFLKMPRWLLNAVMRVIHRLDRKGKVPYDLIKTDPNYSSIFLTNLGSIDLQCGYHHLNNWGTNSCFVVIGKKHLAPLWQEDGSSIVRPVLNIGITLDERIADGYYYSKSVKLFAYLLQHPELLELPADTPVDYLPQNDRRFTEN